MHAQRSEGDLIPSWWDTPASSTTHIWHASVLMMSLHMQQERASSLCIYLCTGRTQIVAEMRETIAT